MTETGLRLIRDAIVAAAAASDYDHRPFMPAAVRERFPHMMDDCQLRYSRFKLAVAQVLQPKTIYEVGTGWGVSALAFISGYPETLFYGIDNVEMGVEPTLVLPIRRLADIVDSDDLPAFIHPDDDIDLIHIDGCHDREHKARDIVKALEARPEWLLVDDVHDVMVAAGTFDGLYRAAKNSLHMLYFEDSHTGNLLIHVGRHDPEYR